MTQVTSPDGTTIAYDRLGAGTPLILVSGASVHRRADAHIAEALSEAFTVYNYDRRGRGDSTDTQPFAVDREIEDIGALLDAASHERGGAALVGLSSGAVLAARAAAVLPVSALVMWEPPFMTDDAGRARAEDYTRDLNARLDAGDRDGALETFMRYVGVPDEAIAGARQSPYWPAGTALAPTLAYDDAAMGEGSVVPADVFGRITAPTLVLAGGASPEFLHAGARAAADAIPDARLEVLEGQTHDVDAQVFAKALRGFFEV